MRPEEVFFCLTCLVSVCLGGCFFGVFFVVFFYCFLKVGDSVSHLSHFFAPIHC